MCDFKQAAPTGNHQFVDGCNVQVGHGDSSHIGVGTLAAYSSTQFSVSDIPYDQFGQSGTLDFNFHSADDGDSWTLDIVDHPDGGSKQSASFAGLSCSPGPGSEHLTYTGTYPDGSALKVIQKVSGHEKIYFKHLNLVAAGFPDINVGVVNMKDMELYFYNKDSDDLAETLEAGTLRFIGQVKGPDGKGVSGLRVEAWDKDRFTKHDKLGTSLTQRNGSFLIDVHAADHKEWIFDRKPDLFFKVFDGEDQIHSTEDQVMRNVGESQRIDLHLQTAPARPDTGGSHQLEMVGIYGGKALESQKGIDILKSSGFDTYLFWSVHVEANGDLTHYGPPPIHICTGGIYTGPEVWKARLADLLALPSTVKTVAFSVGSANAPDYANIGHLIKTQGIGPDSILYKNFSALKEALPEITVIDLDDEDSFDKDTIVSFATMLHQIGFSVTFCPFNDPGFWIDCLKVLNTGAEVVSGFNLQCYAGGYGNASASVLESQWIAPIQQAMGWSPASAAAFVRPGLWCVHGPDCQSGPDSRCPSNIQSTLASWKVLGITGGWIWAYGDIEKCKDSNGCQGEPMDARRYALAVKEGLSQGK